MKKQFIYIVLFICTLILLRLFLFEIYAVNQVSMKNTFQDGNRVLILKNFYTINRNDVVIFNHENEYLIKRCIGLPGESFKIINETVYVNNTLITPPEKAIIKKSDTDIFKKSEIYFNYGQNWTLDNFGIYTIPKKGMKIFLTNKNIPLYQNLIQNDNHSKLKIKTNSFYTFQNDYVFLLGDNRPQSIDSRVFGSIKISDIRGKVILKIF